MVKLIGIDFSNENARKISFRNKWPVSYISGDDLAAAGFFYYPINDRFFNETHHIYTNNISDRVQCFYCGMELINWEIGDIPLEEHKIWSPSCKFIKYAESQNQLKYIGVEIEADETTTNEDFSIESVRIKTFKEWPISHINPNELAAAGFYYCPRGFDVCGSHMEAIIDDRVRCFCCGIELAKWEKDDSLPIAELHKKWGSLCEFIQKF